MIIRAGTLGASRARARQAPVSRVKEPFGPPVPPTYRYSLSVESGSYKSIRPPLEWRDIPPLAVLTGLNGTGKTQLLRSIAMAYEERLRQNTDIRLKLAGLSCQPHEVLFLEDFAKPMPDVSSGIAQVVQPAEQYRNQQAGKGNRFDEQVRRFLGSGEDVSGANLHEAFYRNPEMLQRAIAHHCVAFGINRAQCAERLLEERRFDVDPSALVGAPPWEEINDWFEQSGFPYRLNAPEAQDYTRQFKLSVRREGGDEPIALPDLSPGEASIVRFIFMMYAASRRLFWLKLLILDEPDSHLHASLISTFLRLLQRLVDEQGTRVIMTTHRVETIGFAPADSVFIMHREPPRITPCDDKLRTIEMLSGNLFGMILADKRPVFVEDYDDVEFYALALAFLRESGQWPHAVSPQFVPVSEWVQIKREPEGKHPVRKAVATLTDSGLVGAVSGIIDLDKGEIAEGNIYVLRRYAIENYLLDPITTYAFLLDRGQAPKANFEMNPGNAGDIAKLDDEKLQQIADATISFFEPSVTEVLQRDLQQDRHKVIYANGKSVELPRWLLTERGHTLFVALSKVAVGARDRQELWRAWRRVRLVPIEFRTLFEMAIGCAPEAGAARCAAPDHSDASPSPARTTADQEPRPAP